MKSGIVIGAELQNKVIFNGEKLPLFCGPCVIESLESAREHCEEILSIADRVGVQLIYKSSYDKANRTSGSSFRGLGVEEGLRVLSEIRREFSVPVITDVHSPEDAEMTGKIADVVQVPAFLCRQTDLLIAAGKTARPVLVKKGQFLHPQDMQFAVEKIRSAGNSSALLCERGSCFGYRDLVVDFRSLSWMRQFAPVVFDATHSVQVMGGGGGKSSGHREFVASLARAAVTFGVDGVFIEAHKSPDNAPSDGPNMLKLSELEKLLRDLKTLHAIHLETRS